MTFKKILALCLAVLLLNGALRIIGMTWGLPYQLQPDEPVLFINAWERWDGVPPTLIAEYSPLYLYLLMGQREMVYRLFGEDTPQVVYFFFGRWNSILLSLLVAAVAYRLGKAWGGWQTGLALMLFLTLDPISVVDQGWLIKSDSLAWLLTLLALWAAFQADQHHSCRWLLASFISLGLASLAKYNMAFAVFAPFFVLLHWRFKRPLVSLAALLGICLLLTWGGWWVMRQLWHSEVAPAFEHCYPGFDQHPLDAPQRQTAVRWLPCAPFEAFQRYAAPFYLRQHFWTDDNQQGLEHLLQVMRGQYGTLQLGVGVALLVWLGWYKKQTAALAWLLSLMIGAGLIFTLLATPYPVRQYYVLILGLSSLFALAIGMQRSKVVYVGLLVFFLLPFLRADLRGRAELFKEDSRAATADYLLTHARRGESVVVEYDHVEFMAQYGGFPGGDGYFNIIGVKGLFELEATHLAEQGIYYVVVDERAKAYPEGYFLQPEQLPASYELVLTLTNGYDRHIYRTFRPQTLVEARFGNIANLHGYDMTVTETGVDFQLYWQAQQANLPAYSLFVHVVEVATGDVVFKQDAPPQRGTNQWEQYEWVFDQRRLPLDLPPGDYAVQIGLYEPITGARLPVNGDPTGVLRLFTFGWGVG